jgi:cyclopropane fatty-acyl-phospholipid synthase-like methyltransferase
MDVFQDYAKYYDLLYAEKDYEGEANFVASLLESYGDSPKTLLELGAGTGKHALLLAKQGYEILAVDQSATMLEMAGHLLQNAPQKEKIRLEKGDVRYFETNTRFDAVISLFHVVSYQITDADLKSMFLTVKKHLKAGGIFIFDCWYGPAVLTEKPSVRYKVFKNDELRIERVAVPTLDTSASNVKVD